MTTIAIPFDTLAFVKKLETAGIPPAHAEAQAEALSVVLQNVEESRLKELATKGDILRLERDIKELEVKMDAKIETAKADTIKWTAGMFAAQTALIIGAMFALMRNNQPPPQLPVAQEMRMPVPTLQTPSPHIQEKKSGGSLPRME
ncbi:MAG: DUF1640 domain-containing protein [Magnetococcales bacterium]|nr:DUF1640 domain-containing protein [Magnetococcales bacterium]